MGRRNGAGCRRFAPLSHRNLTWRRVALTSFVLAVEFALNRWNARSCLLGERSLSRYRGPFRDRHAATAGRARHEALRTLGLRRPRSCEALYRSPN